MDSADHWHSRLILLTRLSCANCIVGARSGTVTSRAQRPSYHFPSLTLCPIHLLSLPPSMLKLSTGCQEPGTNGLRGEIPRLHFVQDVQIAYRIRELHCLFLAITSLSCDDLHIAELCVCLYYILRLHSALEVSRAVRVSQSVIE